MALKLVNSTTNNVNFGPNIKLNWTPTTDSMSVSFWFKYVGTPPEWDAPRICFWDDSDGNKANVCVMSSDSSSFYMEAQVFDSSYVLLGYFYGEEIPFTSLVANTWYHIVIVASTTGNNKVYFDKVSQTVTESSWNDATAIAANYCNIGWNNPWTTYLKHHKVWNAVISQTYVNNDYSNPYQYDFDSSCIVSFHFDEGSGSTAADVASWYTQTDGTLQDGAAFATPYLKYLTGPLRFAGSLARRLRYTRSLSGSFRWTGALALTKKRFKKSLSGIGPRFVGALSKSTIPHRILSGIGPRFAATVSLTKKRFKRSLSGIGPRFVATLSLTKKRFLKSISGVGPRFVGAISLTRKRFIRPLSGIGPRFAGVISTAHRIAVAVSGIGPRVSGALSLGKKRFLKSLSGIGPRFSGVLSLTNKIFYREISAIGPRFVGILDVTTLTHRLFGPLHLSGNLKALQRQFKLFGVFGISGTLEVEGIIGLSGSFGMKGEVNTTREIMYYGVANP